MRSLEWDTRELEASNASGTVQESETPTHANNLAMFSQVLTDLLYHLPRQCAPQPPQAHNAACQCL
eukprot:2349471-Amphidinium_carterae.1